MSWKNASQVLFSVYDSINQALRIALVGSVSLTLTADDDSIDSNPWSPVDFIDTTPVLQTATTAIPASANTPLEIVSSLAAKVHQIQVLDSTGEYIGLYKQTGVSTYVLLAIIGLGFTGVLPLVIPAGSKLCLRNMKNAAISSGDIAINFLG